MGPHNASAKRCSTKYAVFLLNIFVISGVLNFKGRYTREEDCSIASRGKNKDDIAPELVRNKNRHRLSSIFVICLFGLMRLLDASTYLYSM